MKGKLLIFWDFDAQWGAERSRSSGGPKGWGPQEFANTERLLDLHAEAGVPACFAVVGEVALPGERPYHDPNLVRRIADAGHEVGSHAMRHEWLPALTGSALRQILRDSKDALEQCTGQAVTTFVPPYNQPFDFPLRGSISLAERLEASRARTDLPGLCKALKASGYKFCRVSYTPACERIHVLVGGKPRPNPSHPEKLFGVTILRLNTHSGFRGDTVSLVDRVVKQGGYAVVYGHPHSLSGNGSQSERYFVSFLKRAAELVKAGQLEILLPREIRTSLHHFDLFQPNY